MWQDVLVSVVAIGAAVILGRRWIRPRKASDASCPSCASGEPCEPENGVLSPKSRVQSPQD